jgi:prepilin-type N-terminal cleavage/methylation domain-containing protein
MKNSSKGFTLIELLVVAALIVIVTAISLVNFRATSEKSRNSKRQADITQVRSALELYRAANTTYPIYSGGSTGTNFNNLVANSSFYIYLANRDIADPMNTASYRYTYQSAANGFTYTLCYYTEPSVTQVCVNNP